MASCTGRSSARTLRPHSQNDAGGAGGRINEPPPEWFNVWNKVVIDLNTHSVKGISNLDFQLAAKINEIFGSWLPLPNDRRPHTETRTRGRLLIALRLAGGGSRDRCFAALPSPAFAR